MGHITLRARRHVEGKHAVKRTCPSQSGNLQGKMWPMKKLGFGSTGSLRKLEQAYEAKNKRGVLFPEGPRVRGGRNELYVAEENQNVGLWM